MNTNRKIEPPWLAQRVLQSFLRHDLLEDVSGDLEENFRLSLKGRSIRRAKLMYWYQVINYLRPFAIRKVKSQPQATYGMYRNYLKTAYRNLIKNKMLGAINVAGLSIGMAVSITIALWIWDEWNFDKSPEHHNRIAQVIQNVTNNGEVQTWTAVPWPLADELRKNYSSDFDKIVLTTGSGQRLLTTPEKKFNKSGMYSEPGLDELLSLRILSGTASSLSDPSSILLSASAAKAYFGSIDPINQIMRLDDSFTVKVAGVYEDLPFASQFAGTDFIASWEMLHNSDWVKGMEDPWRPNGFFLFVRLSEQANFTAASEKIRDAKLRRVNEQLAKKKPQLFLHPMNDWHLYSEFKNGKHVGGRIQYVWLFGIIGIFVLLMACINFMNLTTARSEQRAKEVGIRKAIGSLRGQLIFQFFTESVLMALISFVIALVMVKLVLSPFNEIADKHLELPWSSALFWSVGAGLSIVTGLVAGSYPALYLSSISPGKALKGLFQSGRTAALPRKVLVVLQFTISVVLIVGTVTVFQQVQYAKSRPIGYNREAVVSSYVNTDLIHKHIAAFRTELQKGDVISMAESSSAPTDNSGSTSGLDWRGKDPNLSVDFNFFTTSAEYGKTVSWQIKGGRDFSPDIVSDSSAVILNESAATYMGFKEPVGEVIQWWGEPRLVVGVIKDMVYRSPYEPVRPSIYGVTKDQGNAIIMRINPERSASEAIAQIEKVFKQFNPDEPFNYQFADAEYAKKFGNEDRVGKLAALFTMLAIVISCLGIFGLASFVAEQRTKEIGMRKVLGASVYELWTMLSRDFVALVVLSCFVAAPVAYYAMSAWLIKYTYRTAFPWWTVGAASAATLLITLATVSFHTIRAAQMKPVKSLRSE